MKIGPRKCALTDEITGQTHICEFHIESELTYGERADDDPAAYTGRVILRGDDRDEIFKAYATDEILLVGRLVTLVGSYLLGICEREGFRLSTLGRADIKEPLQLL